MAKSKIKSKKSAPTGKSSVRAKTLTGATTKRATAEPKEKPGPLPNESETLVRSPLVQRPASGSKQLPRTVFPIVGIGASAGGLEAVIQLLKRLPLDAGVGLVVIQHLDPKHESLTAEILSRATAMPVVEAQDGMGLQANRVYVIPPNYYLSVAKGILRLSPRAATLGLHLPIDFFFSSLAAEANSHAIGVVLSGTASDGTQGLLAIKAESGVTFAQEPGSAKYGGMPQSAISAGAVWLSACSV